MGSDLTLHGELIGSRLGCARMAASLFFDAKALESAASAGMRKVFEVLQSQHPDHRIYGFGFYSHEASYLSVTAFSEEGLDAVVDRYEAAASKGDRPYLRSKPREDLRRELRWSPCDSPLHTLGDAHLRDAAAVIDSAHRAYEQRREVEGSDWDPEYDQGADLRDAIYDMLVDVLCSLDEGEVFGPDRDRLVLSIWEGDQSYEDRVGFASRCNPPEVAQRFATEERASYG